MDYQEQVRSRNTVTPEDWQNQILYSYNRSSDYSSEICCHDQHMNNSALLILWLMFLSLVCWSVFMQHKLLIRISHCVVWRSFRRLFTVIWILPWAGSNVEQPALRWGVEQGGHLSAVSFLSCVFSTDGSSITSSPLPRLGTWLNFPTPLGILTGPCSMKTDTWFTLLWQVWSACCRLVPPANSSRSELDLAKTRVHHGTIIDSSSFFWGKASLRSRLKGQRADCNVCLGLSWVV